MSLRVVLQDEEWREAVAEQAYMRERAEEASVDREQELEEDVDYVTLAWGSLSDFARRPYRTAVAETCDNLLAHVEETTV